jgi:hypothetical protein
MQVSQPHNNNHNKKLNFHLVFNKTHVCNGQKKFNKVSNNFPKDYILYKMCSKVCSFFLDSVTGN